MDKQEVSQ